MICENCGAMVLEGTKHVVSGEGLCQTQDLKTGEARGWIRKKPPRDLYKKH
jgi:hypothetical protein